MQIKAKDAEKVLRRQAELSKEDTGDAGWIKRVEELSRLCEVARVRTTIAFLGAALLAKAVDRRVDLKWIKPTHAVDEQNAFSIRPLAHGVLVPLAAEFGFHLGVTGAEPLNNQPFFRMSFLGDGTAISKRGRPPFDYLLKLVGELGPMDETASANALRAFISVRRGFMPSYREMPGELHVTPGALAATIDAFVARNSEGGKRAQACVAGLFDVAFGTDNIVSGRINDPSRDKPGDVCVLAEGTPYKAVEVKDKPVSFADVQIFGVKTLEF